MYYLEKNRFDDYNLSNANIFINYWNQFYIYSITKLNSHEEIDYFRELNLGSNLTEDNVKCLLRWKDPKYLTSIILSGPNKGHSNDRVDKVLSKIEYLNNFRNSTISENDFKIIIDDIFPNFIIWGIFLFHICKPLYYPIADQHVFRSYNYHKKCQLSDSWAKYQRYKIYFEEIYNEIKQYHQGIPEINTRKMIDNALMSFGQFLKKYG